MPAQIIEPGLCVDFLRAWQRDRKRWARVIKAASHPRTLSEALEKLGLTNATTIRLNRSAPTPASGMRRARPPALTGQPAAQVGRGVVVGPDVTAEQVGATA